MNLSIIAATMAIVLIKYRDEQAADYFLNAFLLVISAVLTAAAGYIINDIFDVEADKINKPNTCFVGVNISKKTAWIWYFVLSINSVSVSYFFSEQYATVNLCIMALLYLYSAKLKGIALIGNILIAMCSSAVIASCILLISFDTKPALMNFTGYIVFAFFISLIREIVKDMQDMEGDKAVGLKTYAILTGVKGAKILIYILTGIEIIVCGIFSFLCWGLDQYAGAIIMGIITLSMLYFINHVSRTNSKEEFGASSKLLKYIMFAGVINLIFV